MEIAKQTIKKWNLCPEHANITVGVSGGADSVALLHVLWQLAPTFHWTLQAVHVHHGIRGDEADSDQKFVENLCNLWNIPCHIFAFDAASEAKKRGIGTEEAGRQLRYESFAKIAKEGIIAVAHNQNDQAETILMRLCRGTGLKGLGGIRPKRGNIVRPLLYCTRAEIEAYCKENHLDYCVDSTNGENVYTRNQMRNQVLPLLEGMYPKAVQQISACSERLVEEDLFLEELAQQAFHRCLISKEQNQVIVDREKLAQENLVLIRRVISLVFQELGQLQDVLAVHVEAVLDLVTQTTGKERNLPNGILVSTAYEKLICRRNPKSNGDGFSHKLEIGAEIWIPECNFYVKTEVFSEKKEKNALDGYTKIFDYDKIKDVLYCRTRQTGDTLQFVYGSKKLKDFFIDQKIPKEERNTMPLIAFGSEVIWLLDHRVAEGYLPDENTNKFLHIYIRRIFK
ncbi:tRNA lysidine(34) synthetase TilS [Chakrabartyella piscis]|uniref:tRNA lysidine(34) synthetase TilS n=1 Tax=Chakrabartyella piscis TaxID=2918914 RepID=UPI002958A28A|nr:tRNA lysidine(34) synthetase TilS [Chakrabartyella piscis]